jgi:hypothetical protein
VLHSILGWFKVGLGWLVNAHSSQPIHGGQGGGNGFSHYIHKAQRELVPTMQDDGFTTELGGIMKVDMWLLRIITSWALIWCTSSTQLCCVGSRQ